MPLEIFGIYGKMKKNIETKVNMTGDILRFFCIENAESIIACGWYNQRYCLKTCKFYKKKQEEIKEAINKTKYWNR